MNERLPVKEAFFMYNGTYEKSIQVYKYPDPYRHHP